MKLASLLAGAAALFVATTSKAAEPPAYALDVSLTAGWDRMVRPSVDHARETSATNGGPFVATAVLFRAPYFVAPFVDVGAYPLYRSEERIDLGAHGGTVTSESSLWTIGVAAGPAVDLSCFRLRAGIAGYRLSVHSSMAGPSLATSEIDMGYLVAVSGYFVSAPRFSLGAEARAGLIVEGDTAFVALALTARGDAWTW